MTKLVAFMIVLSIGLIGLSPITQPHLHPGVLLVPGFQGTPQDVTKVAELLRSRGFVVQLYTPPWGDEGESCDIYLTRAKEAYQLLLQQSDVDGSQIMLYGTSLGAYTAARLVDAVAVPPRWLVLHAPANYPDSDCQSPIRQVIMTARHDHLVRWRNEPRAAGDTASLRAVSHYQGDVLIVASGSDASVPLMTSCNYERAARHSTLVILPGAGHSPTDLQQVRIGEIIGGWLDGLGVPRVLSEE